MIVVDGSDIQCRGYCSKVDDNLDLQDKIEEKTCSMASSQNTVNEMVGNALDG